MSEDQMMVGVEYTGSEAIKRFGADLDILPRELQEALRRMIATGGDESLMRTKGAAIARALIAGIKLEMAAAAGVLNVPGLMSGGGLGTAVAANSGLRNNATKQFAEIQRISSAAHDSVQAMLKESSGTNYFDSLAHSAARQEQQYLKSARAFGLVQSAQEKLNRTPTTLQRDIQTIKSAPFSATAKSRLSEQLSQPTQQILATRLQTPVTQTALQSGVAAQYMAPIAPSRTTYASDIRAEMAYSNAVSSAASLRLAEIAIARGQGQPLRSVVKEFGAGRNEVLGVERAYPDLIAAIRQETTARRAAALAAAITAREVEATARGAKAVAQNGMETSALLPGSSGYTREGAVYPASAAQVIENMRMERGPTGMLGARTQLLDAYAIRDQAALNYIGPGGSLLGRDWSTNGGGPVTPPYRGAHAAEVPAWVDQNPGGFGGRIIGPNTYFQTEMGQAFLRGMGFGGNDRPSAAGSSWWNDPAQAAQIARNDLKYAPAQLGAPARTPQTNPYYDTPMGQNFLRSMGLPGVTAPKMASANASQWQEMFALQQQANAGLNQRPAARPVLGSGVSNGASGSGGGGVAGFKDSFMSGFSGPASKGTGEMIGQTARIALFYGVAYRALTMLQRGLEGAIKETMEYEAALTALNIVTGRNREQNDSMASGLSDVSVGAGFAPSVGVNLGAKALGLYGAASADQATQERTIDVSANVATRMARVAGSDPLTTQTQLAGALRSLQWGVERLPQLEDIVSYTSRQTGQAPTELLGAVSNIATLGTAAGFTPQELTALVAQVATTTGQNPESTAGQFRQVLSRGVGEIGPKASEITGVDMTGKTLPQIFAAVSSMKLSTEQLNEFTTMFGKGGSQQVATILTQQYGKISDLAGRAVAPEQRGFGKEQFDEAMTSIGNRLKMLGAAFVNLGLQIVESGMLDWIAGLIVGLQQVVEIGTDVVKLFNSLPRPLRAVALAIVELYAASLLMAKFGMGTGVGAVARAGTAGVAARTAVGAQGRLANGTLGIAGMAIASQLPIGRAGRAGAVGPLMENGTFVTKASPAEARGAVWAAMPAFLKVPLRLSDADRTMLSMSRSGALGVKAIPTGARGAVVGAEAATGLTGAGLLGAGMVALGVVLTVSKAFEIDNAARKAVDDAKLRVAMADNTEALKEAAAYAQNQVTDLQDKGLGGLAAGDVWGLIPALLTSLLTGGEQADLKAVADAANKRAAEQDQYKADKIAADQKNVFTDFTVDAINSTLDELKNRGYDAAQRLDLLNRAMFSFSQIASGTQDAVAGVTRSDYATIAAQVGDAGIKTIRNSQAVFQAEADNAHNTGTSTYGGKYKYDDQANDFKLSTQDETAVRTALTDATASALEDFGADGIITTNEATQIKERALAALRKAIGETRWAELVKDGQVALFEGMMNSQVQMVIDAYGGNLQRKNLGAYLSLAPSLAQAKGGVVEDKTGSATLGADSYLSELESMRAKAVALASATGQPLDEDEQRWLDQVDTEILKGKRAALSRRLAQIDSLSNYQQSVLLPSDTLGRLKIEADAIDQKSKEDTDGQGGYDYNTGTYIPPTPEHSQRERDRMAAKSENTYSAAQEKIAIAAANSLNQLTPGDPVDLAWQTYNNSIIERDSLAPDSAAYAQTDLRAEQEKYAAVGLENQRRQANAMAKIAPGDSTGKLRQAYNNTVDTLANGSIAQDSEEWANLQIQKADQLQAIKEDELARANTLAQAGLHPGDTVGLAKQATKATQAKLNSGLYATDSSTYADLKLQEVQDKYAETQAVVAQQNAKDAAGVAGNRSTIDQATSAIRIAQRELDITAPDSEGYWAALGTLRQHQADFAQAERDQADRLRRLGSDLTNPVIQAQNDVKKARELLYADLKSGQGNDVITQDKLDLKGAENSQEAAAFNQNISDLQTAEDLGRISHTAYLSHLQAEHDRLTSIAAKTRQQQEELDQVDKLMKAASEDLNGQFNIGDIQLPTIYEVRRSIQADAPNSVGDYSHSGNIVNVNGADFDQVVAWLTEYMGQGAQVVRSPAEKKVP